MTKRALVFKLPAMQRIAEQVGFKGNIKDPEELGKFLSDNPDAGKLMDQYKQQARHMVAAAGGMIPVRKYQTGGLTASRSIGGGFNPDVRPVTTPQETPVGGADFSNQQNITDESIRRQLQPSLPVGAAVTPVTTQLTGEQLISPTSGQVTGDVGAEAAITGTTLAAAAPKSPAAQMVAQQAAPDVTFAVAA